MGARILQGCPKCHKPQSMKNTACRYCGKELRRLKKRTYYVDYVDPRGIQKREKIGSSLADAETRAAGYQTDIDRGEYHRNDITFKNLSEEYMNSEKTKALKSYNRIQKAMKHLIPVFGHLPISRITPDAINAYLQRRIGDTSNRKIKTSVCTANREVSYMRAVYNFGIANDLISKYPFGRGRVQFFNEKTKSRNRYISTEEYNSLMSESPKYFQNILKTAYLTAMRFSEILNLTWDRVDLETGFIRLRPEDTKTKSSRDVPIDPELMEMLQELQKVRHISGKVFLRDGQIIKDLRTVFENVRKRAGLEEIWFHDLRGTASTNMLDATGDAKTTMEITGHKTDSVFRSYVKTTEERLRAHIEKVASARKNGNELEIS